MAVQSETDDSSIASSFYTGVWKLSNFRALLGVYGNKSTVSKVTSCNFGAVIDIHALLEQYSFHKVHASQFVL